ncbi:hypothetical protein [Actinoplanes sp. NPDC051851]|uniref:hypothetical protein n=1 Tax=Actinoplanes sp. NPDC051851 TaxID=3154753 RepID=UPI0034421AE0
MNDISGDFETHVTVDAGQAADLAVWAAEHGATFVHIEIDRGEHTLQPMLTLHGTGTLTEQRRIAERWCARLREAGFRPRRTKIEATPWSSGVPRTDEEAGTEPRDRHFEHHVKVRLPAARGAALPALTALAESHGARLSRNARRWLTGGGQERFVNQRCHGVGRETATERLERLVTDLRGAGHEIISVEQEYVAFDDHIDLDAGWLTPSPSAVAR